MSVPSRSLSVVVPSHRRPDSLARVLEALADQTVPPDAFETVVVLDGGPDPSEELLREWVASGRLPGLRWEQQPNAGQAAARNRGARSATGAILVFLDDDVVPAPDLLARHGRHHAEAAERIAVLGDYELVRGPDASLYQLWAWSWWEDLFARRAEPGHLPTCRDFCTGNVSLRREDFLAVGGFDERFRGYGGEDYELGYRLLRAGVRFIVDREARALHYHRTPLAAVLRARRQEAHGDVLLGTLHPELRPGLRLMRDGHGPGRGAALVARHAPRAGDALVRMGAALLPLVERLRLTRPWLKLFKLLSTYQYWRGVGDALGEDAALAAYRAAAPPLPRVEVDVTDGLPAAPPALWTEGPSEVVLASRGEPLGVVALAGPPNAPWHLHLSREVLAQCAPAIERRRLERD